MNLFRSEEHARNWAQFDPEFEMMIKPLAFWAERFSGEGYTARGRPDYISWRAERQQRQQGGPALWMTDFSRWLRQEGLG